MLLVLTGEAAGGAGSGLGAGGLEGARGVLRLEVVPLLGEVHDQLQKGGWAEEGRESLHPNSAHNGQQTRGAGREPETRRKQEAPDVSFRKKDEVLSGTETRRGSELCTLMNFPLPTGVSEVAVHSLQGKRRAPPSPPKTRQRGPGGPQVGDEESG